MGAICFSQCAALPFPRTKRRLDGLMKQLNTERVATIREALERTRGELRRKIERTKIEGQATIKEDVDDVADLAERAYTKESLFGQSHHAHALLRTVEEALARIREGSYGLCVSCGNPINQKRLDAVPWTRYCIGCQQRQEQR